MDRCFHSRSEHRLRYGKARMNISMNTRAPLAGDARGRESTADGATEFLEKGYFASPICFRS
jgi:hypothetical protein